MLVLNSGLRIETWGTRLEYYPTQAKRWLEWATRPPTRSGQLGFPGFFALGDTGWCGRNLEPGLIVDFRGMNWSIFFSGICHGFTSYPVVPGSEEVDLVIVLTAR